MKINHLLSGADYSRQVPAVFRKGHLRLKGSNDFKDLKGARHFLLQVVKKSNFGTCISGLCA